MPKQFVKLFDDKSLFQLTVERNSKVCDKQYIVSNQEQYFIAVDQIVEVKNSQASYLLEPTGRDTAPAIALACMDIDPDEIVLVTPSDHLIKDESAYKSAIKRAQKLAEEGCLVTFGITPDYPEIGYGYIEAEGEDAKSFKEKPDENTAKEYIQKGNYYWNSGMFCFKAGVFLEELEKHSLDIYNTSKEAYKNANKKEMVRISLDDMLNIPSDSIDYAVMEKSTKVKVVPSNIGWSDLGSFDALSQELPLDENNNTKNDHHISVDSHNNMIMTYGKKVATIDVDDLIIIDTADALLISKKGSSQKVKQVVNKLKDKKSELTNTHTLVHRPWGTYEVLLDSEKYKIKQIIVKPGKRLSLQKHFHRNEHWIVVRGTATVTVGEKTKIIRENESTYIKMGEIHRLENEGKIPVVLVEVQVGSYTGEDDIVRIEDDFQRL
jgi:mannose-1-phosphate guanylyltransferase